MDPNNVCRACLGIISEGKKAHNIEDENELITNVRNIREMITFCVPEMDIYISTSPVICESCLGVLVNVYYFKIRCLRVENAIRTHVMSNNVMEGSCVDLNDVVGQQSVEALKQKNGPSEIISEYVDKRPCTDKATASRLAGERFQAMAPTLLHLLLSNVAAGPPKESGLVGVRRSCRLQRRHNDNGTGASESDDVTDDDVMDDDPELETQRVGDELLIDFQEENVIVDSGVQVETQTTGNAATSDFTKKIVHKRPMKDRETLKRKLTPEDIIDEIETKRRKMVVLLSSSLPYLHKNKRLLVKVRRDKFYSCMFCRFTTMKAEWLETHYSASHWVCSLCSYKCKRGPDMAQHIHSNHSLELQEALEKLDEHHPVASLQTIFQNAVPQNGTLQLEMEQDRDISSTTMSQTQRHRVLDNSLDIMNPQVVDEGGPIEQKKIKQPPMVFQSKTLHGRNSYERNRCAHLKECFDMLNKQLPTNGEEKNTSNLSILRSAFRYIQNLTLRENELAHEMERLDREKISHQQRLATLTHISTHFDNVDFSKLLPEIPFSTTSITQNGGTGVTRDSMDGLVCTSTSSFIIPTTSVATSMTDCGTTLVSSSELDNVASIATIVSSSTVISQTNSVIAGNGESEISIPILGKMPIVTTTQATNLIEMTQPVQTTGVSVLPMAP